MDNDEVILTIIPPGSKVDTKGEPSISGHSQIFFIDDPDLRASIRPLLIYYPGAIIKSGPSAGSLFSLQSKTGVDIGKYRGMMRFLTMDGFRVLDYSTRRVGYEFNQLREALKVEGTIRGVPEMHWNQTKLALQTDAGMRPLFDGESWLDQFLSTCYRWIDTHKLRVDQEYCKIEKDLVFEVELHDTVVKPGITLDEELYARFAKFVNLEVVS